jgi:RNA polymerase sigma-70 factor (ECF subfamily)
MVEARNIVNAALAGEMTAWNALYQYYYPRLLNTAFYYCQNTPTAKDLVQDTFLTAFLKLHQLKDASLFGPWIKKILVRKCYRMQQPVNENIDVAEISWEQESEEAEKHSRLQAAMAGLPEALRTTLILRYFSSYRSYNEIAEILSIPVGTVRSRLSEAKTKLSAAWSQPLRSSGEHNNWNQFYQATLSGLHYNAGQRKIFLDHLLKSTLVAAPANTLVNNGRLFFESMVASDQVCGSWLKPVEVISSGNVTVIEQQHFNSPEHPQHCPPASVVIIYRNKEKAERVHIHLVTH